MDDPPHATGPDPDPGPETERGSGRGRAAARELRQSLDPAERERVRETVADLLDVLGGAHAMAILSEFAFAEAPLRFSDLEDELGVAPNTLSARLSEFVDAGLLERRAYDEMPPRVEYEPTAKAEALFPAFGHLHRWALDNEL